MNLVPPCIGSHWCNDCSSLRSDAGWLRHATCIHVHYYYVWNCKLPFGKTEIHIISTKLSFARRVDEEKSSSSCPCADHKCSPKTPKIIIESREKRMRILTQILICDFRCSSRRCCFSSCTMIWKTLVQRNYTCTTYLLIASGVDYEHFNWKRYTHNAHAIVRTSWQFASNSPSTAMHFCHALCMNEHKFTGEKHAAGSSSGKRERKRIIFLNMCESSCGRITVFYFPMLLHKMLPELVTLDWLLLRKEYFVWIKNSRAKLCSTEEGFFFGLSLFFQLRKWPQTWWGEMHESHKNMWNMNESSERPRGKVPSRSAKKLRRTNEK